MKQNPMKQKISQKADQNLRAVRNITGVAGEYFVAAELSRRGWIAVLTLKNTPNIDLIATTPDGKRTVNIQVKTRSAANRKGWIFDRGIETIVPGNNFYIALVDLQETDSKPDYYIIPKNLLAKWIGKGHRDWLAAPGRKGRARVDNPIRALPKSQFHVFEEYHNNWNL
jgi:hypothetical protein